VASNELRWNDSGDVKRETSLVKRISRDVREVRGKQDGQVSLILLVPPISLSPSNNE
jgi:hypothetical protein